MNGHTLLIPGNEQEFKELIRLANHLELKDVAIIDIQNNQRTDNDIELESIKITPHPFRKGTIRKSIELIKEIRNEPPSLIITGAQLAYHRIAFLFRKKNTKIAIYNRGLLGSIRNSSIKSLKLLSLLPQPLQKIRLLNPYLADFSLVVGPENKEMLKDFGVNKSYSIGLFPKHIKNHGASYSKGTQPTIILVTQAYESHGMKEIHKEQEKFINNLALALSNKRINCIIKKHPRDKTKYTPRPYVEESEKGSDTFIMDCLKLAESGERPILFSPPSTFLLEWCIQGLEAILFEDKKTRKIYSNIYSKIPLDNKLPIELDIIKSCIEKSNSTYKIFTQTDLSKIYSTCDLNYLREDLNLANNI